MGGRTLKPNNNIEWGEKEYPKKTERGRENATNRNFSGATAQNEKETTTTNNITRPARLLRRIGGGVLQSKPKTHRKGTNERVCKREKGN